MKRHQQTFIHPLNSSQTLHPPYFEWTATAYINQKVCAKAVIIAKSYSYKGVFE